MSKSDDWSPWKKWWMDVVKFGTTFALAAVLSIAVLDRVQDRRAQRQFEWSKRYESSLKILDEFRRASFVYQETTLDAYWEALRGLGRADSPVILRWQTTVNDDFLLALEAIESRFANAGGPAGLPDAIKELRSTHSTIYDEYAKTKVRRDLPPSELLAKFQDLRLRIIRDVDSFLLRTHGHSKLAPPYTVS